MSEEGGFLGRWSRRKIEAKTAPADEPTADAAVIPLSQDTPSGDVVTIKTEEAGTDPGERAPDVFDAAKLEIPLPSLEEIVAGTDMSPFFQSAVPHAIRNAALRKLWITDPMIRDFENPAREYAYDWNVPGGVPGNGEIVGDRDALELMRELIGKPEDELDKTSQGEAEAEQPAPPELAAGDDDEVAPTPDLGEISEVPEGNQGNHVSSDEPGGVEPPVSRPSPVSGKRRHGGAMPAGD